MVFCPVMPSGGRAGSVETIVRYRKARTRVNVSRTNCAEHSERRLVMNAHEETRERIVKAVWENPHQRIRPIDLEKSWHTNMVSPFPRSRTC